ncbi:MAG: hypothetical protein CSB44_01720 [Gammaproteobacteria bacterium]|nr:MAG: hypothetical protein CSB44_01720 [Gammaproteobacteria bacterium]
MTAALERGIAPGVVCADAGYGHDGSFREALTTLGLEYLLGIQSTTRVVRAGARRAVVIRALDAPGVESTPEGYIPRGSPAHAETR